LPPPEGPRGCDEGPAPGWGVWAPVPMGVVRLEGSSEVKIVAEEGEMM
jgi:hypothetical protein